jgi:hypothetical protein
VQGRENRDPGHRDAQRCVERLHWAHPAQHSGNGHSMAKYGFLATPAPGGALLLSMLFLLTLLPAQSALANRKTDVITLYNGDRITGEIKALEEGRLQLGTDAMGTVAIEWQEIAVLDSNFNYEVRLSDGERYFGSLHPGPLPGQFDLVDVFGEHTLGWEDIVEIRPVEDTITDRLDIYLAANYAFTKASGVSQTEFNADISFAERDATNSLTSRLTVSDTDENATTSSRISWARRRWTDRNALYRALNASFESNDELALDSRVTAGAGVGRYLIDSNSSTLSAGFGLQVLTEQRVGVARTESAEAVLSADFARWRFDTPELDLNVNLSVYPSLTESGRVRSDGSVRLRWEIIDDLYWNMNAWGSYDNEANEVEGSEFDWGINTGLGWNF